MEWNETGAFDTINNLSSSGGDTVRFTASKLKCRLWCSNIAADRPGRNQQKCHFQQILPYLSGSVTNKIVEPLFGPVTDIYLKNSSS